MVVLGGGRFLVSEVPLYRPFPAEKRHEGTELVQGYLAHKETPAPLGPPEDPRQRPTVGS